MSGDESGSRSDQQVKQEVREHYSAFAQGAVSGCGDDDALVQGERAPVGLLYGKGQLDSLPDGAVLASAGCGNPTALASLRAGETVVDFGSGGGIDCFLAAQAVGPTGRVIGIDMTNDMIELARKNAGSLKTGNVEFHLAGMEDVPLEDSTVDVVISNCVICLAPDKDAVFAEAFRILRPGGRLFVSDIALIASIPEGFVASPENWVACAGGAEERQAYVDRLSRAGFRNIEIISETPYAQAADLSLASLSYVAHKPA